jgi:phosphatidylserine decarboxylase
LISSSLTLLVVETKRVKAILKHMTIKQGKKYDDPSSRRQIIPFIRFHNINIQEIEWKIHPLSILTSDQYEPEYSDSETDEHETDYDNALEKTTRIHLSQYIINLNFKNFNEFFYRKLRKNSRNLSDPENPFVFVSPADCRVNLFESIELSQQYWIKGSSFSLKSLLDDEELAKFYEGGSIVISRLAPQDYHRFHHCVRGTVESIRHIEGCYYTVNPMAIRVNFLSVYTENRRTIVTVQSNEFGKVTYICVGAMMVGSIEITCPVGSAVDRMSELGYFAFGGSTILVLLPKYFPSHDTSLGRISFE